MELLKLGGRAIKRLYGYYVLRPMQRYNIENRAEKVLEAQGKVPVKAPMHKPTKEYLEQLLAAHPEIEAAVKRTEPQTLENLKQVRVVSTDVQSDDNFKEMREGSERPLPARTRKVLLAEMGVKDPDYIPEGKVSLRQAIDILKAHRADPRTNSISHISQYYKLSEDNTIDLLDNFRLFHFYDPQTPTTSRVPWYYKARIDDLLLEGWTLYDIAKLEAKEKRMAEHRKVVEAEEEKRNRDLEQDPLTKKPKK